MKITLPNPFFRLGPPPWCPSSNAASGCLHIFGITESVLRERFMSAGAGAVADYEMLRTRALPGAATTGRQAPRGRPARQVPRFQWRAFGSGLDAPADAWGWARRPITELKIIEAAAPSSGPSPGHPPLTRRVHLVLGRSSRLCRTTMSHKQTEQFRVLFPRPQEHRDCGRGTGVGHRRPCPRLSREIVKRALELQASAIILVHNHPSGDPTPSAEDRTMTQKIADAADALGITLHDHLVNRQGE